MKLTIIAIILCVSLGAKAQQDCKHSINSPFHSKNVILLL